MGRQRQWLPASVIAHLMTLPLWMAAPAVWALSVDLEGVEGEVARNIRAYLQNIEEDEYTESRLEVEIRQRIEAAIRVYGYYEPDISIDLPEDGNPRLTIDPGPQVTIETLDINVLGDAAEDEPFQEALERFPLKEGDTLRHAPWDRLRGEFSGLAIERGYFDWGFTDRRMEVRPYLQSAQLYMDFDSGPRYQFGETLVTGSHIQPERLQKMRTYQEGEPYLAESLARFNQRLAETGWFSSVSVTPRLETAQELSIAPSSGGDAWWVAATESQPERPRISSAALSSALSMRQSDDASLPIDVRVEPANRHQFETGLGFATDVGPRLRFGWDQPWINRYGHSLDHDLYLSAPEQRFTGVYDVPLEDPLRDSYRLQYGIRNIDDSDTDSLEGTVEIARRWEFDNDWVQSLYFRTTYEDFTQGGEADQVWLFYPGVQWSRTRTRPQRFPLWGDRQQFSVEYSDPAWGSDAQFLRITGDTEWIRTYGDDNRFSARVSVGAIETNDFDKIPPSLRFFVGGDRSVRGYSYEGLSPRNEEGKLRGGQQKITSSLEYQRRVTGDWWGATFVDAGDAFDNWGPSDLKKSAGLGVRWISPVGPIRFDIAHPFDDDDDNWRLHFSIGPEF
ncbi:MULTISPECIES: autotransporter assembly complex protein TamA [unclassified Halomonas]|uniref:autotransporter assembly complex protein TamA n=1 Tax=unclassified Halomonas TaxID=2609666 RepID=UPI0006D9DC83|nr:MULTISPECIES: autotransporter assembly complex family protein [unclassified Halomonas]KPQ19804.1 MAG: autotransporter translocation and assembly module outer membrane component TamA [Halomonas sp. HL-93]SBR48837.1 autotransporter secretion outer membrane protein TamA [Halomonas sp. HL-93]SNY96084.1 autotransporter secretion outer membrane protein TamA [Halomonas sp. hl-4]